jgi:hydroxymethylglutaryl-CoA reductase (NADPH)
VRWPRRNDASSVEQRRAAMGVDGGLVTSIDLAQFSSAAESLVGVAVIPVSAAPIQIELGEYDLSADGDVEERARTTETVHVPLAHTEGGLTASMTRGALAAGAIRTYVLYDRITRASCFVCKDAAAAVALARWVDAELPAMRAWLESSDDASLSKRATLRGAKTHVVGPMCHVLWQWTTGDAVGPNMMTRNSYALNMAYVMQRAPSKPERAILEANMGGDKKPSAEYFQSGHGKTVLAEAFLSDEQIRRVLRTTAEDLESLSWAGTHGSIASGMQSVAFTPASAVAAVFAATGQDLGMVGTSSMAHGTARRVDGGLQASIRFGGLEVGTVGGGTTLPSAREWLASIGCAGSGKVYRFAQIVAAAALSLEISASAAMATAGSENFFRAHHERGGLR